MSIYSTIYYNLCNSKSQLKDKWCKGSGLHRHHIIPEHSGGLDEDSNFTYLTVREHIIAHYLLYKMNKNPNDLRSMRMLGAKLTPEQRRIVGIWCRDNNIGIHSATLEQKSEWQNKGRQTQKESGDTNSFYYWSTEEGRKERASLGGKASLSSGNNKQFEYWMSPEGRKERAKLGAASSGKKSITNGVINRKLKTEEERQEFIKNNPEWRIGITRKKPSGI